MPLARHVIQKQQRKRSTPDSQRSRVFGSLGGPEFLAWRRVYFVYIPPVTTVYRRRGDGGPSSLGLAGLTEIYLRKPCPRKNIFGQKNIHHEKWNPLEFLWVFIFSDFVSYIRY